MSQFQAHQTVKAQSEVNRTASETSSIHLFAEHGNMDEVLRCLAEGVQVDKRDTRRQTALHCACSGGHADLVKFLIEKGADVEAKDGKLITPLHKAAMSGSPECVKLTLAGGAVVNARDDKSNTPLHWACMKGNLEAVEVLISSGGDSAALNNRKQAPADVIGDILYVRHDVAKVIKQKLHGLGTDIRVELSEVRQAKGVLEKQVAELEKSLLGKENALDQALGDIQKLKKDLATREEELKTLRLQSQRAAGVSNTNKSQGCCTIS